MRRLRTVAVIVLSAGLAAACAPAPRPAAPPPAPVASAEPAAPPAAPPAPLAALDSDLVAHYATRTDLRRRVPGIDPAAFDPALLRQRVRYETREAPGTIVVDTAARHLYLVEEGGTAIRYGIAIGRDGFGWTGEGIIARRAAWPTWTPPPEMIRRDPKLARWAGGMPGSAQNPLGARALYIYIDGRDSQYRIHGTNDPASIGTASSSGCFRMLNHDAIDLYERVQLGARVVVI